MVADQAGSALPLRAAFIAAWPANDRAGWSGIVNSTYAACQAEFIEVRELETRRFDWFVRSFNYRIEKFRLDLFREIFLSKIYGIMLRRQIKKLAPDVIIAIACSTKIAVLRTTVPIIHMSDATFRAITNYYPGLPTSARPRTVRLGDRVELLALQNCAAAALASQWAAHSAIVDYGIAEQKVHVVPMGANVAPGTTPKEPKLPTSTIRLLFVGIDWERKGGAIVFKVHQALQAKGLAVHLDIVGCDPPEPVCSARSVECHGFLNRGNAEEAALLHELYSHASYFIFPTRQEAYGLVLCEACAYGVPVLTTDTGGVSTVISHNKNGFLFGLEEDHDAYVEAICGLQREPSNYQKMSAEGIERFQAVYNWEAWARQIGAIAMHVRTNHDRAFADRNRTAKIRAST